QKRGHRKAVAGHRGRPLHRRTPEKSPAATSAQGKSAVGVTVRLWDYGHKKAPTKSGQGSHTKTMNYL
ncbi:hypothetical protein, partial [Salmonella enterica]|uniref:hypothetical protein n=1 Tax=Salmonella enterica TaxID=28901 RepID=UPI0019620BDF